MPTLDELFQRRWCYFIPLDGFVPGKGFRVSVVFENEPSHYQTGGDGKEPWFWGMTYEEAEEVAAKQNETKLGLSARDVWDIISSSMGKSWPERGPNASKVSP